jgi:DNA-binding transcriptional MerR regulator
MNYSISDVAKKTGLSASAIRYYEDQKLLSLLPYRKNGRRIYDVAQVSELSLLNDLRHAGMTLADIKHFQNLRQRPAGSCVELSLMAADRAKALRAEILILRQAEARLTAFASSCDVSCGASSASSCGQIDQLRN